MRDRERILKCGELKDSLILEILLDIRDLLKPQDVVVEETKTQDVVAPLYISDKPPKKKKRKK